MQYAKVQPNVRVLDRALTTELYGFTLRKDETALTAQMNKALQTLRAKLRIARMIGCQNLNGRPNFRSAAICTGYDHCSVRFAGRFRAVV